MSVGEHDELIYLGVVSLVERDTDAMAAGDPIVGFDSNASSTGCQ